MNRRALFRAFAQFKTNQKIVSFGSIELDFGGLFDLIVKKENGAEEKLICNWQDFALFVMNNYRITSKEQSELDKKKLLSEYNKYLYSEYFTADFDESDINGFLETNSP